MNSINQPREVLIRITEVCRRTGLRPSSIYALQAAGKFPRRIKVTDKASAWVAAEVDDWISARIALGRGEAA